MITATLTQFVRKRGEWRITILYTDTDTSATVEKTYTRQTVTKRQLRNMARKEAVILDANNSTDVVRILKIFQYHGKLPGTGFNHIIKPPFPGVSQFKSIFIHYFLKF